MRMFNSKRISPKSGGADYASNIGNNLDTELVKWAGLLEKQAKKSPLHCKGQEGDVDASTKHRR